MIVQEALGFGAESLKRMSADSRATARCAASPCSRDAECGLEHIFVYNMLGVRREGVTEAASKLQKRDLIHYVRGRITLLDRKRLEERSCECYAVVKSEYDRLLPPRKDEA